MTNTTESFFQSNRGIMSETELEKVSQTRILLVGLGGLGGHLANSLTRLGIHSIVLVDDDRFSSSNLNRQLFSSTENLGEYKTDVVLRELKKINPDIELVAYHLPVQDIEVSVFDTVDLIIDAVDEIKTKLFLETMGKEHHKPLLHGAIGGWYGQMGISLPGSNLIHDFYGGAGKGLEKALGSPTFIPPIIANMMVAEMIKFLLGRSPNLANQMMMADLLNHEMRIVSKAR